MPKVNIPSADCVERAIKLYKKHPTLSVLQLMKQADFPAKDQDDHAVRSASIATLRNGISLPNRQMSLIHPLPMKLMLLGFQEHSLL
jgi:hypothetical protein